METKKDWKIILITLLSLVGLFDSSYLTATHFSDTTLDCSIVKGCDLVLQSPYSEIVGIPTAFFGILFYLTIFLLSVFILLNPEKKKLVFKLASVASVGFLASLTFIYLQAFVINAWCQFCILSAITSTIIFILSWLTYGQKRTVKKRKEDASFQNEPKA